MARGLPQGCARGVRVIAANHAAARDNAGKRHAQGRVGGACIHGIADYNFSKARSIGPLQSFSQLFVLVYAATSLASAFPSGPCSVLSVECEVLRFATPVAKWTE